MIQKKIEQLTKNRLVQNVEKENSLEIVSGKNFSNL